MDDAAIEDALERAAALFRHSELGMALTGAGVSTSSGIPDFRSPGGLWSRHDPMEKGSAEALRARPKAAWELILDMLDVVCDAEPNPAHTALARLEAAGYLQAIVTQNIDNLHQEGGSLDVIEFHGGLERFYCMNCGKTHDPAEACALSGKDIPWLCPECGGLVRPDIVFFGEPIPPDAMARASGLAAVADLILVVGASGEVAPANALPYEVKAKGGVVIDINRGRSAYADMADVRITARAEIAAPRLVELLLD